jgi:hypothetical protein
MSGFFAKIPTSLIDLSADLVGLLGLGCIYLALTFCINTFRCHCDVVMRVTLPCLPACHRAVATSELLCTSMVHSPESPHL